MYGVDDILNAVMVMLDAPNPDSPENVDAGVRLFVIILLYFDRLCSGKIDRSIIK